MNTCTAVAKIQRNNLSWQYDHLLTTTYSTKPSQFTLEPGVREVRFHTCLTLMNSVTLFAEKYYRV
jgi:hypothetical protein